LVLAFAVPSINCAQGNAQKESPAAQPQLPPVIAARLQALEDTVNSARTTGSTKAKVLDEIGELYYRTSNYSPARDSYNRALTMARSNSDPDGESAALSGLANCDLTQGKYLKALELFQQALEVATKADDPRGQAVALNGLGWASSNLGRNGEAEEFQARALPLARQSRDQEFEATTLLRTGAVAAILGHKQAALGEYNQALLFYRSIEDRFGEAAALNNLGVLHDDLGDKQLALDTYNQALSIRRDIGDRDGAAWTLNNIGNVYKTLRTRQDALALYTQALGLFVEVGDRSGEAAMRNNIGAIYRELGEQPKALDSYELALPLYRETGDRGGEAATLTNIGNVYYSLGDKQGALDSYKQALPIRHEVGNPAGEANTLNNIGAVYVELDQNATALSYLDQALKLRRSVGDRAGEAATLINLGNVDFILGDKQKALKDYTQAMELNRALGDSGGEAGTLNNVGFVYSSLGDAQKALGYFNRALPLATAVHDPIEEARVYCNLMRAQRSTQPSLAIFYGKQAINLLQQVRGNIQGLDRALQKSFLDSKEDCYQQLAELLIAQGRLPEAQQVLDLLKQQEYSDYVRGEIASTSTPIALTPAEQQAEDEYQKSTARLVSLGEQWSKLRKIANRTADQSKQYEDISAQLEAASKGLSDYYSRLYVLLGKDSGANRQMADVKGDVSLLKQAIAKQPHIVALYTLVGTDRISIIVISSGATVARTHVIARSDLYKKVVSLQRALRDPNSDPKPLAHEMYDILIGPVATDLEQAQAETLVWALDGVLRYVPVAALFDGKQYMVEKYDTVTITPASMAHLSEQPDVSSLSAAAMGISGKYEEELPALPAVRSELYDIVDDSQVKGAKGVLPGTILLDGQFTEKAMEDQLSSPHSVLHIASHFVFRPGDASQSYLLLAGKEQGGTGFHLTVAEFRDDQRLTLDDIDLLTLSACETGMTGSASNGREVDGLGTTAQLKGAKAVISSLWEVNDESTGELMSDFYRRWSEGGGKLTKVMALRDAQLDLLMGKIKPKAAASALADNAAASGYSHPYFWAPFVLMGNWR
jgi:CHAT domain-containing protein/Tfp pilus assembly protein PilF